MMNRILHFIKLPSSKYVMINTLGNYLNVFFTVFLVLILTRAWNPVEYGVFSVLFGIAYVLANILDFGTTATIYSYLPPLLEKRDAGLLRFVKSTFYYQTLFSVIIIGVLFIGFPFLDKYFFKTGAPLIDLYLTAISVLFFIWQNFIANCLYAAKRFLTGNIYLNVSNIFKTIAILVLIFTHSITIGWVLFIYGILGPIVFFIMFFIEKKDVILLVSKAPVHRSEFRFKYTMTYFIASQFLNLGLRMDLFLLSYFQLKADVGYYAIAQKIILTIITTIISITQVLSPAFSRVTEKAEIKRELKTGFLYLLIPSGLFLLLFFTPSQLFDLSFTSKFTNAAPISKALSLPFILYSLGSLPMLFLLYTVKKPRYILWSYVTFFILMTLGCIYFIPKYGVYGPPFAIAIGFIVSTTILTIASVYEYRKLKG